MMNRVWTLVVAALVVNAMVIGATWDQTIKQLPAREELPELIRHAGKQDWITAGLPIHQPATHLES